MQDIGLQCGRHLMGNGESSLALAFYFPVLILCANLDCTHDSWSFVASALDLPTTALPLTATSVIPRDLRQRRETEKVAAVYDNES